MKTLLIDSNFLCHRAVHVVGNLEYRGVGTGVTFGFFNQLINVTKHVNPDKLIFFWDSRKSERKKLLPTYKDKRKKDRTEEEKLLWKAIYIQFNKLRKIVLPEIGFHNNFMQSGYESDDLIAQYCRSSNSDEQILIATSDEDMFQLLSDNCSIYKLKDNSVYGVNEFQKEKLITPDQWVLVKQIAGCTSDNIPGVPGVGEKTAIKYILGELKESSKAYQKIKESEELISFNKKLVSLPYMNTIDIREDNNVNQFSMKHFLRICRQYGFSSFRSDEKKEEIRNLFSNI